MAVITPKDAKERTGIISAEAAIRFNVDAMNRDPNVVTRGLGERVVKPATEILWAGFFYIGAEQNSERATMNLFKRLCREEEGQGLTEYTLVIVLVALVFWMGVRDTQVGQSLAQAWTKVLDCVTSPFSCTA